MVGAANTTVEELEARPSTKEILEGDTNEGFKLVYNTAIAMMKERKGLSTEVEMRLARSQWQMPGLKMGKDGGVAEAEK